VGLRQAGATAMAQFSGKPESMGEPLGSPIATWPWERCHKPRARRLWPLPMLVLAAVAAFFAAGARAAEPSQDAVALCVQVLDAGDPAGPALLQVPLADRKTRFGIVFRHSVERSPVFEWFVPAEPVTDGLVLVATEYESFGAGLPTEAPPGARFHREDDRFIIDGLAVTVSQLALRPMPWTEHRLLVEGMAYDLSGLAAPGMPLLVRVVPAEPCMGH